MPDTPGRIGPYTLLGELGRGGMGVVYRARREDLRRDYALKVILAGRDASDEMLARFRREAQAAARLSGQPGIVGVHDIGEDDGRVYFAMDLVEGRSLDALIDSGELTPERTARLLEGAARAVHAAHAHGILHRDLKPANVMVAADDTPRITDFGLAKAQEAGPEGTRLTRSGTVLGTPAYMSPEQARSEALDARADVWSLGATLFEALAGRPPFEGESVFAILGQLERRDAPLLRRLDPRIPRELETITRKCLERDPALRYDSAQALAEDLARYRQGDAILAHAPSVLTRVRKAAARHRALVAGAALAALAVVVLGSRAWLERGRRAAAEDRLAAEQALAMDQLRKRTRFALEGALELRRAGHVAAMATFGREAEAACREAMAHLPASAEPHARLGRMYRALLRDDDAMREQEQALAKDPSCAPARYERVVLRARQLVRRADVVIPEARRSAERLAAAAGGGRHDIAWQTLLRADAQGAALFAALEADLRALEAPGVDLPPGELACARGLLAWLAGDLAAARAELARAVAQSPLLEEAYDTLAQLARSIDDDAEAIRWWTEGLARDAGYLPHREGRGRAHAAEAVRRGGRGEDVTGAFAAAIADFDDAIARDSARATAWTARGGARLSRAGWREGRGEDPAPDLQAAIRDLDEAIRLAPADAEAWEWRGLARANWGHRLRATGQDPSACYQHAIDDFGEALGRAPERARTWMLRAIARDGWAEHLGARGEEATALWTAAESDATEALQRDTTDAELWHRRGSVRASWAQAEAARGQDARPRYARAIDDLSAALDRERENAEIWHARGTARANLGQHLLARHADPRAVLAEALEDYAAAARLNPRDETPWRGRGVVHCVLADFAAAGGDATAPLYQAAVDAFDEAIARNPNLAATWLMRGGTRVNWGNACAAQGEDPEPLYAAALEDFDRTLALHPGNPTALLFRGNAHNGQGRWRQFRGQPAADAYRAAVVDWEAAIARNPDLARGLEDALAAARRLAGAGSGG